MNRRGIPPASAPRLLAALVQLQPACGALGQVVPQRRAGDVPDDGRDLPGQGVVCRCLLGCWVQRDLDAAAGEGVVPGGCEPGTARGAESPDSWPGCPDRGGPRGGAVPGRGQGQRAAAGPVVVQRDDRCAAQRLDPAQGPAGGSGRMHTILLVVGTDWASASSGCRAWQSMVVTSSIVAEVAVLIKTFATVMASRDAATRTAAEVPTRRVLQR
jgi:hypothetical protein